MERAVRVEQNSEALAEEIASLSTRTAALDKSLDVLIKEQAELFQSGEAFERILADLGKFRHERTVMQETLDDLARNVTEFSETDQELRTMLANYDGHARRSGERIADLQNQRRQAVEALQRARDGLDIAVREEGRFKAEAEAYEQQILKREHLIKQTARQHNVRGFELDLDEEQVTAFGQQFRQLLQNQAAKLERMQKDDAAKEDALAEEVQAIMMQRTAQEQQRVAAKTQLRQLEAKLQPMQVQLERAAQSGTEVQRLQEEITQAEKAFETAVKESEQSDWDVQIRQKRRALETAEDDKDAVNAELSRGSLQADARAKFDIFQSDLKRKEEELVQLGQVHGKTFEELTSKPWSLETLGDDLASASSVTSIALKDNEITHAGAQRGLSTKDVQVSTLRDSVKKQKRQLRDLVERMEDSSPPEILQNGDPNLSEEERVAAAHRFLKSTMEEMQKRIVDAQAMLHLYDSAYKSCSDTRSCLLCERDFEDQASLDHFISRYQELRIEIPRSVAEDEEHLAKAKHDYLDAFMEAHETWQKLSPEVQQSEIKLRQAQTEYQEAHEAADKALAIVADLSQKQKKLEGLKQVVSDANRLGREVRELTRKTANLQAELVMAGARAGSENLPEKLATLQQTIRDLKRDIDRLTNEKELARIALSKAEMSRRDLQHRLAEEHGRLREQEQLATRVKETQEAMAQLQAQLIAADEMLRSLEPQLAEKRAALSQLKEAASEHQWEIRREMARLTASQNTLQSVQDDMDAYLNKGGPAMLKQATDKTREIRAHIQTIEDGLSAVTVKITEAERQQADHASAQRNMNDNLRLRRMRQDVLHLERQVEDLESKNAERDRERYLQEAKRYKDRFSRLQLEKSSLLGELRAKDDELKKLQRQLEIEFKDAAEVYRRHFIKVATMEKANEDLEKYGKALDSAIMRYHAIKMDEINRTIQDLWQTTYVGTDVDRIYIESEGEPSAANRTYKYNVRMVKGEAEFEMRGRCSAGQKMLACIIIRLALAECFGISCGVLTLDEPTTNLDAENIKSLARALHNLVQQRRRQANFQLIVITHDETFLKEMGVSAFTDFYWRVFRDGRQTSQIEQKRATAL
jgi:DNA repair protein RAD50